MLVPQLKWSSKISKTPFLKNPLKPPFLRIRESDSTFFIVKGVVATIVVFDKNVEKAILVTMPW